MRRSCCDQAALLKQSPKWNVASNNIERAAEHSGVSIPTSEIVGFGERRAGF